MKKKEDKRILLVSSAGGHLAEILELHEIINKYNYLIVTEDLEATRPLRGNYNVKFLRANTKGRSFAFWLSSFMNFFISFKILISFKPDLIITTGSYTAVPLCIIGKILGKRIIWILAYARASTKEKSATLFYPFADVFLVQWETAKKLYPKSEFLGSVY